MPLTTQLTWDMHVSRPLLEIVPLGIRIRAAYNILNAGKHLVVPTADMSVMSTRNQKVRTHIIEYFELAGLNFFWLRKLVNGV